MSGRADTERLEWLGDLVYSISGRPDEATRWKIQFWSPLDASGKEDFRASLDAAMDAEERE